MTDVVHDQLDRKTADDSLPYRTFEDGQLVGRWVVPVNGFRWESTWVSVNGDVGHWLVPNAGGFRRYPVLGRQMGRLRRDFVALASDTSLPTILAFANRYGPLGAELVEVHRPGATSTDDWELGEPLVSWERALAEYRLLSALADDIAVVRYPAMFGRTRIRDARRSLRVERTTDSIKLLFDPAHHGSGGHKWIVVPGDSDEVTQRLMNAPDVDVADYYLVRQINQQLSAVHPMLFPFREHKLRLVPSSLLAVLYLRLAQGLNPTSEDSLPERACDSCGLPFKPNRRDNVFCTGACKEAARYRRRRLLVMRADAPPDAQADRKRRG